MGKVVYNIFFHPLRSFPGPITHAASRIPYCIYLCTGRHPFHVHSLHARYGPVVRIAPDELAISGAGTAWKDIMYAIPPHISPLSTKPPSLRTRQAYLLLLLLPRGHQHGAAEFPKSWHFYNPVPAAAQNDIVSAPRGEHALLRRALSHGFSDKSMRLQEPLIARYIDLLIARLRERAAPDRPLNIMAWYNYTTFDVIGDLAFGEAFGCLEKSDYHPWVKAIFYLVGKPVLDVEKCKLMWDGMLARQRAAW